jgi:predicted type IV restriction endonuclease
MELKDELRTLSARIPEQLEELQTEEATKRAFVLPLLAALGYNVYDPTQVTRGFGVESGTRQKTVDYAIWREGRPIMLIECKHHGTDLANAQASQLHRYFGITGAAFGLFTNGVMYRFYTDSELPNKLDAEPFFMFNMLDARDEAIEQLRKFSRSAFDPNQILTSARELAYTREIRRVLQEQLQQPSDEFVTMVAAQVYAGRMTHAVKEQFAQLTRQAFVQLVNEQINDRLKSTLGQPLLSRTL